MQATREILARPDGFADEVRLLARPWGIDLAAIAVPAALWSGAEDTTHPTAPAGAWRRCCSGAPVTVVPGAATFGLLRTIPTRCASRPRRRR